MPEEIPDEVAPALAVTRTIGGVVLVLLGTVMLLAGGFWFFLVPWFGWATEGLWFTLAEWADLGGAALGILGFVVLIVGGALIQRARKRRLQIFVDASTLSSDEPRDGGASTPPTPIL